MQRRHFFHLLITGGIVLTLQGCGKKKKLSPIPKGATVLALGDSITEGVGASEQDSYPAVLADITGWNVINAGISGDTSAGALNRLPGLLKEHQPALVLTSIGGNDFLRKINESTTRANILNICKQVKEYGVPNMLIAIPQFSVMAAAISRLSDHPMYKEIAKEMDIPLQEGGWSEVLSDKSLRSDEIHANAQGYARFAELLVKSLRTAGLYS